MTLTFQAEDKAAKCGVELILETRFVRYWKQRQAEDTRPFDPLKQGQEMRSNPYFHIV
jgi:hypothetical protein